jgi:5-methylcytosine-specific restriction endonuclease McrA
VPLSGDAQPHPKEAALKAGRPRRYRRRVAGPKQWAALRADLYLEPCAVCGWGFDRGEVLEAHHLVPRALGGGDVSENLVPLHVPCHKNVTENEPVSLAALAVTLDDSRVAYIVAKLGENGMQRLFGVDR